MTVFVIPTTLGEWHILGITFFSGHFTFVLGKKNLIVTIHYLQNLKKMVKIYIEKETFSFAFNTGKYFS